MTVKILVIIGNEQLQLHEFLIDEVKELFNDDNENCFIQVIIIKVLLN